MSRLDEIKARRLDEIKARAEAATDGPWLLDGPWWTDDGGPEPTALPCVVDASRALVVFPPDATDVGMKRPEDRDANMTFIAAARDDVPWLVSEVERLTAERDALARIKRNIDEVRNGTGWTVQIYGVLLQQCDEYGKTLDTHRAERAEAEVARLTAERDALIAVGKRQAARLARVEALAEEWDGDDSCDNRTCVPHRSASALRAALTGSEADTSDTQPTTHESEEDADA